MSADFSLDILEGNTVEWCVYSAKRKVVNVEFWRERGREGRREGMRE